MKANNSNFKASPLPCRGGYAEHYINQALKTHTKNTDAKVWVIANTWEMTLQCSVSIDWLIWQQQILANGIRSSRSAFSQKYDSLERSFLETTQIQVHFSHISGLGSKYIEIQEDRVKLLPKNTHSL